MLFAMNFKKLTLTLFTRNITHLKKNNYRPKSKASESSLYDQIYEYIGNISSTRLSAVLEKDLARSIH